MDKRIVLLYRTGAWAGLYQIQGTRGGFMAQAAALGGLTSMPARVSNVDFHDHSGSASLMYEKAHYVLYAETDCPSPAEDDGA